MTEPSNSWAELRLLRFHWFRPAALLDNDHPDTRAVLEAHAQELRRYGDWPWRNERYICASRAGQWIATRPLDAPQLFDAFAQPNASDETIVKLCQTYGMLTTHGLNPVVRSSRFPTPYINDKYVIDSASSWRMSMTTLSIAVKLHEYANHQITSLELKNFLAEYADGAIREFIFNTLQITALREFSIQEAQTLTYHLIDREHTINVHIKAELNEESGQLGWSIVPQDLESAIWTLFIQSVTGQGKIKRCEHCAKIYAHASHKDRMYCSGACKQRASRQRRRQQA
jgi:hypothetical protein